MRPAPSSSGGFLKTLPNVRLLVGWVAFRRATSSDDRRLDVLARTRIEPKLDPRDDLALADRGVPVRERQLVERQPVGPVGGRDQRPRDDVRPFASVRAGVHLDAASHRARDGARELEATEARVSRAVQADGIRGASAGDEARRRRPRPQPAPLRGGSRAPRRPRPRRAGSIPARRRRSRGPRPRRGGVPRPSSSSDRGRASALPDHPCRSS